MNNKWDKRFLLLAEHISEWSKDPSTRVGAVIVDNDRRILSLGYNGFPIGVNDSSERLNNKFTKLEIIKHAEENALFNCRSRPIGCTIYITHPPCSSCAGSIIQHGITSVVYAVTEKNIGFSERWKKSFELASELFEEAGVSIRGVYL
jgi:dCMP deaminase